MPTYRFGAPRLLAAILTLAAGLVANPAPEVGATHTQKLQTVAHRGDQESYPYGSDPTGKQRWDNSWGAVENAVNKGADWIEIDVRINLPSGRVLLNHDSICYYEDSWGWTNVDIETASIAEIYKCGRPELGAVLDKYKARGYTRFIIELKETSANRDRLPEAVYNILKARGMLTSVWISCLDDHSCLRIRDLGGRINSTLWVMRMMRGFAFPVDGAELDRVKADGYRAVNVRLDALSSYSLGEAQRSPRSLLVSSWEWPNAFAGENTKAHDLGKQSGRSLDFFMTDRLSDLKRKCGC